MLYTRGAESDYNDWEALGNKGWGFNDVLPLIKKVFVLAVLSDPG
jgi:choline dehydrogenase